MGLLINIASDAWSTWSCLLVNININESYLYSPDNRKIFEVAMRRVAHIKSGGAMAEV